MFDMWTPEEEAANLKKRFDALKATPGLTITQFASDNKAPGGPSLISQHCSGTRAISYESALAYARGFKVPLEEISPRIALMALEGAKLIGRVLETAEAPKEASPWIFPSIEPSRLSALRERELGWLEGKLEDLLKEAEARQANGKAA